MDIGKERPCLNMHIKKCMGVCRGKISSEEYKKIIDEALEYLKTGSQKSVDQLTEEMNEAAENLEFEKAAKLRDQLLELKGEKPQAEQIQKKRRRTRESTRHH